MLQQGGKGCPGASSSVPITMVSGHQAAIPLLTSDTWDQELWEVCIISRRKRGGMWGKVAAGQGHAEQCSPCRRGVTVSPCPVTRATTAVRHGTGCRKRQHKSVVQQVD